MKNEQLRALKLFKVLSNATRYKIICLLANKSYEVNELSDKLKKPGTTISRHLKILRDLDIVSYYTNANKVIYSLKKSDIIKIIEKAESLFIRKEE